MENKEPLPVPEVNKNNKGFIFIGVILLLILVGAGAFILGQKTMNNRTANTNQPPKTIKNTEPQPSPTSQPVSDESDKTPKNNVLYFVNSEGFDAVFFTNEQEQKYYEGNVETMKPNNGTLKRSDGLGKSPINYMTLTNPRRIPLDINYKIQAVNSVKSNNDKTFLYVSINIEEKTSSQYPENLVNRVYQINVSDLSSKEIWVNELGSDKYPASGVAYIEQIADNKFIAMMLGDCYACGGHTPTKNIIVNAITKKEKYLDMIGDVKFNLSNNTFTYKKLTPAKEPCETGPGCDENGQRAIMKPAGQDFTEQLP